MWQALSPPLFEIRGNIKLHNHQSKACSSETKAEDDTFNIRAQSCTLPSKHWASADNSNSSLPFLWKKNPQFSHRHAEVTNLLNSINIKSCINTSARLTMLLAVWIHSSHTVQLSRQVLQNSNGIPNVHYWCQRFSANCMSTNSTPHQAKRQADKYNKIK